MAHNINYNEISGTHSFFSVKEKAWHGLGQIVSDYPTSAEAIQHAELNYAVEKRHLFTYDNENNAAGQDKDIIIPGVEIPNYFATIRTDTQKILVLS